MDLFRAQVDSIRAQTHRDWICIVNDDHSEPAAFDELSNYIARDPRFHVKGEARRAGFYWNFGRALNRVPDDVAFVALADQDDVWQPHKLERLVGAMSPDVTLAYSDQRIVDRSGRVLANTFWTDRENYCSGLRRMLVSNTVTGAATLFRRELLEFMLPLPPRVSAAYHDHWLALAALSRGRLAYVDEALYDYVQHADQVLGRQRSDDGVQVRANWDPHFLMWRTARRWQDRYFERVVAQQVMAAVLLERLGDGPNSDRRVLRQIREADTSMVGRSAEDARIRARGCDGRAVETTRIAMDCVEACPGRRPFRRPPRRRSRRFRARSARHHNLGIRAISANDLVRPSRHLTRPWSSHTTQSDASSHGIEIVGHEPDGFASLDEMSKTDERLVLKPLFARARPSSTRRMSGLPSRRMIQWVDQRIS
jgi:hypothetical protein